VKELRDYPPLMLLSEAANYLRVSVDTVVKYGQERRIVIVGTHNSKRVRRASILDYEMERSEWHERSRQRDPSGAGETPAPFGTDRPAQSRGRRAGRTTAASASIVAFRTDRKLRNG